MRFFTPAEREKRQLLRVRMSNLVAQAHILRNPGQRQVLVLYPGTYSMTYGEKHGDEETVSLALRPASLFYTDLIVGTSFGPTPLKRALGL
jgi:hypothetical protein